ncbi:arylesterase [Chitinilyticum litopenaei]|uniref:arylesterase n=1 Tax=Chitinilyticum litopenaei TaxID=1121276 RepID=UPI0003FA6AF4|nr:arylesterase [Chitinilyticum litopenaei]
MVCAYLSKKVVAVVVLLALSVTALAAANRPPRLLVFGDSLSAGYGLPANQAWPALLQARLKARGLAWQVSNASVSGETTAGGLTRFPAMLKQLQPDVVVLELGANDGLRGLPTTLMQQNLVQMARLARASGARVHLVGMRIPPNYGPQYTAAFEEAFRSVAREEKLPFTPFLLAPLNDERQLFQNDQLHPTAEGQARVAGFMEKELAAYFRK